MRGDMCVHGPCHDSSCVSVKPVRWGTVDGDGNVGGRKRLRFGWVVTVLYILFGNGTYLGLNEWGISEWQPRFMGIRIWEGDMGKVNKVCDAGRPKRESVGKVNDLGHLGYYKQKAAPCKRNFGRRVKPSRAEGGMREEKGERAILTLWRHVIREGARGRSAGTS